MPNGLWYAGGETHRVEASIPSSAFSRGDLLIYTSASSLSRMAETFASGADIAGIALGDSTQSIDNKVPYLVPGPDTLFWASADSATASLCTPGFECDILFAVANQRYYVAPASTNSVRAVIVRGNTGVGSVDQSVQSKALIKLIYHAGNVDIS